MSSDSVAAQLRARLERMKAKKGTAPVNGIMPPSDTAAPPSNTTPLAAGPPPEPPAPSSPAPQRISSPRVSLDIDTAPCPHPPRCHRGDDTRRTAAEFAQRFLQRVASGEKRGRSPPSPGAGGPNMEPLLPACRSLVDAERYRRMGTISQGVYGVVSRGVERSTGKSFALKAIKGNWLQESRAGMPGYLLREMDLGLRIKHPHIVGISAVAVVKLDAKDDARTKESDKETERVKDAKEKKGGRTPNDKVAATTAAAVANSRLLFLSDYAGHTLRSDIERGPMCVGSAKHVALQLLSALEFMHRHHVVHRDMKPSNVLIDDAGVVRVCDLGLARTATPRQRALTTSVVTLMYRAPELHFGAAYYDAAAVDMWSLGCILAELFLRHPLFPAQDDAKHLAEVCTVVGPPTNASFPGFLALPAAMHALAGVRIAPAAAGRAAGVPQTSELTGQQFVPSPSLRAHLLGLAPAIPDEALDLVDQLLQWCPRARPTAVEALHHPFFARGEAASPDGIIRRRREAHELRAQRRRLEDPPAEAARPPPEVIDSVSISQTPERSSVGVVPDAEDDAW